MPLHPIGFWSSPVGYADVITLSGTTSVPNEASILTTAPDPAFCEWEFRANGTVYNSEVGQFQDGVEWSDLQDSPTAGFWIRATLDSGTTPSDGDVMNTWISLFTNRSWGLNITEFDDFFDLKIEISPNSSGSPIVATGYYKGTLDI